MLDLDLDQQLRDEFRSTADRVEPSARLDGLVRDRLARRQMQRRITLGGGAALGLALVVGVTAALIGNQQGSVTMSPADSDSDGGRGSVNADAGADADLDTDGGVNADADVTAPVTVPPVPGATTSLVPPVDGVPALPGAETVTGSFAGDVHKVIAPSPSAGCQIETTLDSVLTMAGGKTWHLATVHCLSRAITAPALGEFTIDMPTGDTMTGDIEVQATSSGVAVMTITGGTGAYAGAQGTCQLDGWAVDFTTLGTFPQQGTFSCSIAGVASH